jgi:hypothetical protein
MAATAAFKIAELALKNPMVTIFIYQQLKGVAGNWVIKPVGSGFSTLWAKAQYRYLKYYEKDLVQASLTNPKIANEFLNEMPRVGPSLSNDTGIPEPAVKSVFQLAKEFATSPLGVTVMIAGAILRSGVPISPVFKKFLQKGPGSGFRETCRYIGRVMNYYLGLDDELQTLLHNKMGLKSPKSPNNPPTPVKLTPKSPNNPPTPVKLTPKSPNRPVMVSQAVQTSPRSPSPNYIYVGGRKIPLRRKPMSPAKAKEGRLRKVVRRVLHGRTEEEKMMKLAKALRKRALAASARSRSRSASAARSRPAKN